jgi:hypothetical protein
VTWRSLTQWNGTTGPAHEERRRGVAWCGAITQIRGNRFSDRWKTEADPPADRRCVKCRAVKNKEAR